MRLFTIAAALTSVATTMIPAIASADTAERTFTRDGHTYVYTTTERDNGRVLIEGKEVGAATRFRLLVDGDRVSGQANGRPVSFRAPQPLVPTGAANN